MGFAIAHRLKGKILFELKDFKASGESYREVLKTQPNLLSAWKGLAELHATAQNHAEAVVAFQSLVSKTENCMCCVLNRRKLLILYNMHLRRHSADSSRDLRKQGKKAGIPAEACLSSSKACQLFRCSGALAALAAWPTGIHRTV